MQQLSSSAIQCQQPGIGNYNPIHQNDLETAAQQAGLDAVTIDQANGITDPDVLAADQQAAHDAFVANAGGFLDPVAAGQAAAAAIPSVPIGQQTSPFIYWTSWVNHSFQDKEGYIRLNPSFGLTTFQVKRYYDDPAIPEIRSKGYGYTFDVLAIPVRSYWTTVLRFDAYNKSDLIHRNTTYTATVGNAWDFHSGNKGKIRLTLDYQLIAQQGSTASQRFVLGFWPVW